MAFATGKFSFGLCDYCGQRYPYNVLRKNWRGFKVCPDDYEPKEPQLDPLRYKGDAIAIQEPRPDRVNLRQYLLGCLRIRRFRVEAVRMLHKILRTCVLSRFSHLRWVMGR